jgi:predicted DNA-binding transcriptional regulator YafY
MTLAIDSRMEAVSLQEETFERKEKEFAWVKDLIGLNTAQGEEDFGIAGPVGIEFEVKRSHKDYLKAMPLHPSQISLGDGEGEGSERFRLRVLPNYELVQTFLRLGDQVKLIKPDFFVKYYRECLEAMIGEFEGY